MASKASAAILMFALGCAAPAWAETDTASRQIQLDLDGDRLADQASVHMRPHDMRIDVEIILSKQANRTINLVAIAQPPKGPLVNSTLRRVEPGTYSYACDRVENRDANPCTAGTATVQHEAIVVVTPGLPELLIWMEAGQARVVRLPGGGDMAAADPSCSPATKRGLK